jgi:hypothetical protein
MGGDDEVPYMRKFLPLLLLSFLPAVLHAQDIQSEARHYLVKIGVQNQDVNRIIEIQTQTRKQIREAQLELNVLKAELEKALFPIDVNMKEVQRLLDQSLGWKMKSELARIKERVELRKILGDIKYADYQRFMRAALRRSGGRANGGNSAGNSP